MIISGKYEVLDEIGRGGMGIVYKVRHLQLDACYALKMLLGDLAADPGLVARFHHEAKIMAQLQHPHIVRVFDIDRDGDRHFFVMEYVEGNDLAAVLRDSGALSLTEVIRITRQLALALAHAHAFTPPVIHRDIKPSNIMCERGGNRVVLTDFGIAKLAGADVTRFTRTGVGVGTVRYCSPEQLKGSKDIDARADIYSLGLVMYEMLSGQRFYAGMPEQAVVGRLLSDMPQAEVEFDDSIPRVYQSIVSRCIAPDRDQRFTDAGALIAALDAADEADRTRAVTVSARHPGLRWLPLAIIIMAATGLILGVKFWPQVNREEIPQSLPTDLTDTLPAQPADENEGTSPDTPQHEAEPEPAEKLALNVRPAYSPVQVPACTRQEFSVAPGEHDDYHWQLDGIDQAGNTSRYSFTAAQAGEHRLTVRATSGRQSTEHNWEVQVTPLPPDEAESRQWAGLYLAARQDADVPALVRLGYTGPGSNELQERLASRLAYRVRLEDLQFRQIGASSYLVIKRVDTWQDGKSHSMVVDYKTENIRLQRENCTGITGRRVDSIPSPTA